MNTISKNCAELNSQVKNNDTSMISFMLVSERDRNIKDRKEISGFA